MLDRIDINTLSRMVLAGSKSRADYQKLSGDRSEESSTSIRVRVVLLVDWSGSKKGAPWGSALKAAQAITLAQRTSGSDVRAGIFSGDLWHAPGYSPDALFAASLGPVSMVKANGPDTSFRWLPRIWQLFPDYRILLLTDGYGYIPQIILPSQKARTARAERSTAGWSKASPVS